MPNITQPGVYTSEMPGFEFLSWERIQSHGPRAHVLLFSDGDPGTSCLLQYIDDTGVARTLENGEITVLPQSLDIVGLQLDLQLTVTGSPNFNLTGG